MKRSCFSYVRLVLLLFCACDQWFSVAIASDHPSFLSKDLNNYASYQKWAKSIVEHYPELDDRVAIYQQARTLFPDNDSIYFDWVTLLSWSEQHNKAIDEYVANVTLQYPIYTKEALALSARAIERYDIAQSLYISILDKAPDHINANLGLSSVEISLGRPEVAIKRLKSFTESNQSSAEALELLAYAYNQLPDSALDKIKIYQSLLKINPDHHEVRRLRTLSLIELGLIDNAQDDFNKYPELYDSNDRLLLIEKISTLSTRKLIANHDPQHQQKLIQEALLNNQQYLELLNKSDLDDTVKKGFAIADRLVVLNTALEHEKAITLYQDHKEDVTLPDYGLVTVADSYLSLYRPNQALSIVLPALEHAPHNLRLIKTAYYASMDINNKNSAEGYLQRLSDLSPEWLYSPNSTRRKSNKDFQEFRLMQAMHHAYLGQLIKAKDRLDTLVNEAPANNDYKTNLSTLYRWLGWYDLAQQELDMVFSTDPEYLAANIAQAYNDMATDNLRKAQRQIAYINNKYSRQTSIERLNQDWSIATDSILSFDTGVNDTDGSSFASRDVSYNLSWYSQIINYDWRLFYKTHYRKTDATSIRGDWQSHGVGAHYQRDGLQLELELFSINELSGAEFALSGLFNLTDYWSLEFGHQTYSQHLPVRAFLTNVNAHATNVGVTYRKDDYESYSLTSQQLSFSDNNDRISLLFSAKQNLYHDAFRLDFFQSVYYEKNSEDDQRFYYNPKQLSSVTLGLEYRSVLYKKAITQLTHSLRLDVGWQQQKFFKSDDIWSAYYQHIWRINKRWVLNYGLGYSQKHYDGEVETGPFASIGFEAIL